MPSFQLNVCPFTITPNDSNEFQLPVAISKPRKSGGKKERRKREWKRTTGCGPHPGPLLTQYFNVHGRVWLLARFGLILMSRRLQWRGLSGYKGCAGGSSTDIPSVWPIPNLPSAFILISEMTQNILCIRNQAALWQHHPHRAS